jgi:hypothetical protein
MLAPIALHAGFLHLAFNSLGLLFFSRLTERLYGSGAFFLIYVFSGVCGTAASFLYGVGVSVGASGAIYGVLGATIGLLLKGKARFPEAWRARYLSFMVMIAAVNLFFSSHLEQVDNAAHVGGLIGGLGLGMLLARRRIGEKRSKLARTVLTVGLVVCLVTGATAVHRTLNTSREDTLARLPAVTLRAGPMLIEDLSGTLLHAQLPDRTRIRNPFGRSYIDVTTLPAKKVGAMSALEFKRARLQLAMSEFRQMSLPPPARFLHPDSQVGAWRTTYSHAGQLMSLVYAVVTIEDGSAVVPVVFKRPAPVTQAEDDLLRNLLTHIRYAPE